MKTKLAGMGGAPAQTYVDDVFSTYLYTGTGATQTITNGIDLAGKGGLVWAKQRSSTQNHFLFDTLRGVNKYLQSTNISSQGTVTNTLPAFNSNGFDVGSNGPNTNATTYASWTFRKAAKFFDVVTYTGNGGFQIVAHSLGTRPGLIIIKRTDSSADWAVFARTGDSSAVTGLSLNSTTSAQANTNWINATATTFPAWIVTDALGNAQTAVGATYVAYLFAHDTSSTGIIQCGSFNSAGGQYTLGWEPQYFLIKRTDGVEDWQIYDTMRGWTTDGTGARLVPNTSAAESSGGIAIAPTATGFNGFSGASKTYIYMAIRRPNKPPTTGTQVFSPVAYTGNSGAQIATTNFAVDMSFARSRLTVANWDLADRLRGSKTALVTNTTQAETANGTAMSFDSNVGVVLSSGQPNVSGDNDILNGFKRAPGFFDEVCYTGVGAADVKYHNLNAIPELMIVKNRSNAYDWYVFATTANQQLVLNSSAASQGAINLLQSYSFTTFKWVDTSLVVNGNTMTYVAYLFATLAGISKVGSYTGNGSSQNIECGFAAGARFILIKCTSTIGDWFVWDTARGIVSANDPHLSLNTTAAEVTTDDSVDPYSAGFAVNQVAATNINVSSATYIFLAIA